MAILEKKSNEYIKNFVDGWNDGWDKCQEFWASLSVSDFKRFKKMVEKNKEKQ